MFYWMNKKDSRETYKEQRLYIEDDYLYYIPPSAKKKDVEEEVKEERGAIIIDLFSNE